MCTLHSEQLYQEIHLTQNPLKRNPHEKSTLVTMATSFALAAPDRSDWLHYTAYDPPNWSPHRQMQSTAVCSDLPGSIFQLSELTAQSDETTPAHERNLERLRHSRSDTALSTIAALARQAFLALAIIASGLGLGCPPRPLATAPARTPR